MRSKLFKFMVVCLGITVLALSSSGCSRDRGRKLVIKGSTTVLPIAQKAAEAFRKTEKVSISIEGSGSGNGIRALIDGNCDIANASRAMKKKEIARARVNGIRVREIVVAYDMIVPIVHSSNKIVNISMDQLKGIYDGSISNWKQLGGKDSKIVVISRDTSSGTYEVWNKKVMKKGDVRKDALLQASNGTVITTVSKNPRAIGYVGFGYINDQINSLRVDGIAVTLKNGKSGKYPISRKLFMYIDRAKASAQTLGFIDFLTGKKGQKLVKEAGYISL